jgi:tetracycline 7-halogenase / FADH2 O2-dependent halogenase
LQRAKQNDDWNTEQFRPIERAFWAEVQQIDWLVNGMIQSFRNYDLFKQYWRNWIIGTVTHFSTCILVGHAPAARPMLYGSGLDDFRQHVRECHDLIIGSSRDDLALAAEIKQRTEPWWDKLTRPVLWTSGDFSISSPVGTGVHGANQPERSAMWLERLSRDLLPYEPDVRFANAQRWLQNTGKKMQTQMAKYHSSLESGGDYHLAYRRILDNQNLERFDYYQNMGLEQ